MGAMGSPLGKLKLTTSPEESSASIAIGSCAPAKKGEERGIRQKSTTSAFGGVGKILWRFGDLKCSERTCHEDVA